MYAAADAYAGLGDLSPFGARQASDAKERTRIWRNACAWYETSLSTLRNIPNASRVSPAGLKTRDSHDIARRFANCIQTGYGTEKKSR
jgi:hypothetical protein